jgi:hypothetical protein
VLEGTSVTRTVARIAIAVCAAVAISACGSSSKKAVTSATSAPTSPPASDTTSAAAAAQLNSCTLVDKQKAQALIGGGTTFQDGVHAHTTDVDSCTYTGDPSGPTAQVEVFIGDGAKKFYDDDNDVLHHTFTNLPGVGDEAHEEDFAIFFRKGSTWVALRITSLNDYSTFKARAEALAKDIASAM